MDTLAFTAPAQSAHFLFGDVDTTPPRRTVYHGWLQFRHGKVCEYHPPLSAFLICKETRVGYVSHHALETDPLTHRLDAYIRKGWHRDETAICVANVFPNGSAVTSPNAWLGDDPNAVGELDLVREFVEQTEMLAYSFGIKRVAWSAPALYAPFLTKVLAECGYKPSDLVRGDWVRDLELAV